jgi:anaerobic selenocysteine-containing dehydrogenase
VYNGLKRVAFLVVSDMFMTPTAALADIVLPAATYLEYDGVVLPPNSFVAKVQRKVAQIGEARSDHEIISDMACKLGLDLGDSGDGFWDAILKPVGVTFREFEKMDGFSGSGPGYRAYEENGFKTPSGKVEFYSKQLEDMGVDPMPAYRELPETPQTDPDLAKEYPLFCTTRKLAPFRHSGGRQISSLREDHSEPVVLINPETASQLGVTDGDWVSVETKRGEIKQRANLSTDVDPRVVVIDHAWWYPEKGETELFGWAESNDNVLTNNRGPFAAEVGSVHIIGFLCKVCKVSK